MKLHELKPAQGSNTAAKRKGRGHGSGNGKTAGYGHKGQKARSGVKNIFATEYATVKISDLEAKFEAGSVVDTKALVEAGIIKKSLDGVKILGNGELTKALTVQVAAFTASAKEKIEKAGGKAEVI